MNISKQTKFMSKSSRLEEPLERLYVEHVGRLITMNERLCQRFRLGYVLIASGRILHHFHDDREYPFKVNPSFKHWLPLCEHPNSYLLLQPGETPVLFLYQPDDMWLAWSDVNQSDWKAAESIESLFNIIEIQQIADISHRLSAITKSSVEGAFIGPTGCLHSDWPIKRVNDTAVLSFLYYHRSYKSPYEIRCLYQANVASIRGHLSACRMFKQGATEAEIFWGYLQANGITQQDNPYEPIIALNEHGAILHYQHKSSRTPASGVRSLLIDAANQYAGYAADITRTYSLFDDAFADLIEKFDILQQQLVSNIKIGLTQSDLHELACLGLANLMKDNLFISCSAEAAYNSRLVEVFYPHGLGHMLGLQVHDVGGNLLDEMGTPVTPGFRYAKQGNRPIEAGMALTVEPGFYFVPGKLEVARGSELGKLINWETVEQFMPYGGIRVEDSVVLHEDGLVENLTRSAFLREA